MERSPRARQVSIRSSWILRKSLSYIPLEQKPPIQLDALKQQTFSHGVRKKTKKEIEKENEEKKRIEEEKYVLQLISRSCKTDVRGSSSF